MDSGDTDRDRSGNWLDRLEDAEFSETDERSHFSVLEQPIDASDADELCRLLHTGEIVAIRARAAAALGMIAGSKQYTATVVDDLIRAVLEDGSTEVQARAIDSLYLYDPDHIDRLAGMLIRSVTRESGNADPAEFVSRWLTSGFPAFRLIGAATVEILGQERMRSQLVDTFDDNDRRVQLRAIESYGRSGPEPNHQPVERMLRDANSMIRRTAASTLVEIGTDPALEALLSVTDASDDRLQRIAVSELHRLDRRRTARALVDGIKTGSETVRQQAIVSLMQLCARGESVSHEDVCEYLTERLEPSTLTDTAEIASSITTNDLESDVGQKTKRQAVRLLGEMATSVEREEAGYQLVAPLRSPDKRVRDLSAEYLRQLEGEQIEEGLRSLSRDSSARREARRRAASILEQIKQNMADSSGDHSIEYTYVRQPADYSEKHER
jgi:HEAT repeat protein